MATGGRKTHLQVMHEISVDLGPLSAANGLVGVLPAGAILDKQTFLVSQAFNSTTNGLAIGTTLGGSELIGAVDIKTLAHLAASVGAAFAGPYLVDTPIYYRLSSTGPAPTQGRVIFWYEYLPGPG